MNKNLSTKISEKIAELLEIDFPLKETTQLPSLSEATEHQSPAKFLAALKENLLSLNVSLIETGLTRDELIFQVKHLMTPCLLFKKVPQGSEPEVWLLYSNKLDEPKYWSSATNETKTLDSSRFDPELFEKKFDQLNIEDKNKYLLIGLYPWQPIASKINVHHQGHDHDHDDHHHDSPLKRLFRLLRNEEKDILYIYIYAVAVGLISLSLPLGIQAIIGLISGGLVFNSVVVLISLVIIGVLLSGGLQIMQITLVEMMRRRVFVKASYEFAYRIPRLKKESLKNFYTPELVNRFFDVVNIQKGLPKLFIDLIAALIQIAFGLILLAAYHPFFIFFGIGLIIYLYIFFRITSPKGVESNINESIYKYKIVQWLEEMARVLPTFKDAGNSSIPLQKTDVLLGNYLYHRKKHFKVLVTQFANLIGFKTVVTGGLLILGTILVVDRQITLGQFVASEVVIILIVQAVEKTILSMEVVYDLLTGLDKIGHVTDLPIERQTGLVSGLGKHSAGIKLEIHHFELALPADPRKKLHLNDVIIEPGQVVGFAGLRVNETQMLGDALSGVLSEYKGSIAYDGLSVKDLNLMYLRDYINRFNGRDELFDGTILENITMGKPGINQEDLVEVLHETGVSEFLGYLPDGLSTHLPAETKNFPADWMDKISLAKALIDKPKLLVVSNWDLDFPIHEKKAMLQKLIHGNQPKTIVFITNDESVLPSCDKIYLFEKGLIKHVGKYNDIKTHIT
jgi:ABC-type bacteriocin/lantibiotic exporter with double-glycine peptidase domain